MKPDQPQPGLINRASRASALQRGLHFRFGAPLSQAPNRKSVGDVGVRGALDNVGAVAILSRAGQLKKGRHKEHKGH